MNRSWGTVGVLMCATIVMGVGLTGCGADAINGDQPLTVIAQVGAEGDTIHEDVDRVGPPMVGHDRPGGPAGMHGHFRGAGAGHHGAGMLDLTDEQREQARGIHEQTREDTKTLRDAAHEEINGLLTEEQLAQLEELRTDRAESGQRQHGERRHGEREHGERRHGEGHAGARGSGEGHHGARGHGPHRFGGPLGDRQRPIDSLELSEEQRIAIDVIRDSVHEDIRALHDNARDAFRAILTPEQIEIFDRLHPPADDQIDQPDAEVDG